MYKKIIFSLLILLIFHVQTTFAENETDSAGLLDKLSISVSATTNFYSRYLWRGFTLDKDPVIQPGITLSGHGVNLTCWTSWDTDNNDPNSSDEIDYVFDYTYEFSDYFTSIGHTYYDFPGTNNYSKEFYFSLGMTQLPYLDLPINAKFTYYRDYGNQNNGGGLGNYYAFDFSYSHPILETPSITLDMSLHFGLNQKLFIKGTSGQDLGVSGGATFPLTKNITCSPSINYSIPFGDLKDKNDGNQKQMVYAGVGLAYSF